MMSISDAEFMSSPGESWPAHYYFKHIDTVSSIMSNSDADFMSSPGGMTYLFLL
jgi:hypothetical protein